MTPEELNKKWQEAKRLEETTKLLNKKDLEVERHTNRMREIGEEIEDVKEKIYEMENNDNVFSSNLINKMYSNMMEKYTYKK